MSTGMVPDADAQPQLPCSARDSALVERCSDLCCRVVPCRHRRQGKASRDVISLRVIRERVAASSQAGAA